MLHIGSWNRRRRRHHRRENCWLLHSGLATITHLPGKPISSGYALKAIETGEVVYADGNEVPYAVRYTRSVKLGSTLVIRCVAKISSESWAPLNCAKRKTGCSAQLTALWERGIAQLLSRADHGPGSTPDGEGVADAVRIKLLHAQVNPHFLFNALNTIKAVIRRDA